MGLVKLRFGLRTLRIAVVELTNAIKEHSSAIHAQNEVDRNKKFPTDPKHIIVSHDEETVRNAKHEQDRQYRTQNSIKTAAWCAFGAAVIYAGIAAFQWNEMHTATIILAARLWKTFREPSSLFSILSTGAFRTPIIPSCTIGA